jgi:hypothetical protein
MIEVRAAPAVKVASALSEGKTLGFANKCVTSSIAVAELARSSGLPNSCEFGYAKIGV